MLFDAVLLSTHAVVLYLVKTVFRLRRPSVPVLVIHIHIPWSLFLAHYLKAMGVDDDSSLCFKNYDHGFHSYFSLELFSEGKCSFGSGRKNVDACQATLRWYNFALKD